MHGFDINFEGKKSSLQKNLGCSWNQTQDFNWALLPLSHWTHAEASLFKHAMTIRGFNQHTAYSE